MADHWHYRIEPYRRIPGESGFTRVEDGKAELWFGFRSKGDDHRCFGAFPSRREAEKAVAVLKERDEAAQAEASRRGSYHLSHRRNGTEDEIIICAPGGRHMAYIWFWDAEYGQPGVGDKQAKADAKRIIHALNAYQPARRAAAPADAPARPAKAYHTCQVKDSSSFPDWETIDIRAPSGRTMAFRWLDPDDSPKDRAQATADTKLIADALNAHQPPPPQRSRQEGGIRGTLRNQLEAKPKPSTGRKPKQPDKKLSH